MNNKIKMAVMALGFGLSLNAPIGMATTDCNAECFYADQVCAAQGFSPECAEAIYACESCKSGL